MATIPQSEQEATEAPKAVLLRNMPQDLHRKVKARASGEGKTLQAYVVEVLSAAVGLDEEESHDN